LKKLGIENGEVAKIALIQKAIIITFDSDYLHLKKSIQQELRIIFLHMHRINPILAKELLEKNLDFCIEHLHNPGKVIISEQDCVFKTPTDE
jgi:predicted nuclease of predicted toxin-antitoxin system